MGLASPQEEEEHWKLILPVCVDVGHRQEEEET